eukprot:s2260_g4.t1
MASGVQSDFDGEKLVLVDRSRGTGPPLFRIVHLERNHHTEVDNVPAADSVTLLKLWGASYLICAQNRNLLIYDYEDQAPGVKLIIRGQGSEIMAVDSQDPEIIASLDRDAVVKLWNGRTAECVAQLKVPDAHYHMGYPYYLCVSGHRLLLSADEGVFLAELDEAPAETFKELPEWVQVDYRGKIEMKGKGQVDCWLFKPPERSEGRAVQFDRFQVEEDASPSPSPNRRTSGFRASILRAGSAMTRTFSRSTTQASEDATPQMRRNTVGQNVLMRDAGHAAMLQAQRSDLTEDEKVTAQEEKFQRVLRELHQRSSGFKVLKWGDDSSKLHNACFAPFLDAALRWQCPMRAGSRCGE